ncbi:MAG: hypothetical protein Mars2KO_34420 [Maribacter sp.]
MKTVASLLFFLLVGVGVQAQADTERPTVAPVEITETYSDGNEENITENKVEMARIYKYRISRIKKALSFMAKKNNAKVV